MEEHWESSSWRQHSPANMQTNPARGNPGCPCATASPAAELFSPQTTTCSWIGKSSFPRRAPEDPSSFGLASLSPDSPPWHHPAQDKQPSPACRHSYPQVALRTAVTQHKDVMLHTSPATWNVSLPMAEGSSKARAAELVGLLGAADQGTKGHTDILSNSGNIVTHHGWAGTKNQMARKEGE